MKMKLGRVGRLSQRALCLLPAALFAAPALHALVVHGVVTDTLDAPIPRALVALVQDGKVVVLTQTAYDGSYQLSIGAAGRFYVLAGGTKFRQLATESFYGGVLDSVEKNVALEPETVRQAVVVTGTGTPTPEAQVSASITRLDHLDFQNSADVTSALRLVPGFHVVQSGGTGSQTSLFIRGGNSDDNKITLDGVPMEDIGGTFDFANLSSTGIADAEAYRGANSVLYGANAAAGVVAFTTPRGSTPFPSVLYQGDGGNFGNYRNEVQAGGTRGTIDYYAALSGLQTTNSVDNDSYHVVTSNANMGYALGARTSVRVTARNSTSATGSPGQYVFTKTTNDAKQSDQNIYMGATVDHTFSDTWHGYVQYGLTRKREQYAQYAPTGEFVPSQGVYLGQNVTVTGANGYTVNGQAILNYAGTYPSQSDQVSNRDSYYVQTDHSFSPHVTGLAAFRYEDQRGSYQAPAFGIADSLGRGKEDYTLQLQGDAKNRLFYTLGGAVETNQLYGTVGAPHLGASYYLVRPGAGLIRGTRLTFNFSKGYKEPTLNQQFNSLYQFLLENGGSTQIHAYNVQQIGAALTRSYDGGVEQSFHNEQVTLRATYFHNEFGNQVEAVTPGQVPALLPNLTADQQIKLQEELTSSGISPDLNSLSYRAQGVETEAEYGYKKNIFFRGGYTYLDSVVQHSFTSDAINPSFNTSSSFATTPIGASSPLVGARPFRRPPHTGFVSVTYTANKFTAVASSSFASRSDDSTFLAGSDANFGNSLLLPNHNLDSPYASMNMGITYKVKSWAGVYTQLDNLLSQQHISPIGYLSTPMTARAGVRITLGKSSK